MKGIILKVIGWIVFMLVLLGALVLVSEQKKGGVSENAEMRAYFLKTQEDADCILIKQETMSVLIDTGEEKDAESILEFLKEKEVSEIEYLILTHPDKDHIGGASQIIDNIKVKQAVLPIYNKEDERLDSLLRKMEEEKISIYYPTRTRKFSVGNMYLTIFPPLEKQYSKDNNYSLTTLLKHGKVTMLFTGDAEKKRLEELKQINLPSINLLKVPHHGRANSNSEQFLQSAAPDYAVITAKEADEIVQGTLEKMGSKIFFTRNKTVEFQSNGEQMTVVGEGE